MRLHAIIIQTNGYFSSCIGQIGVVANQGLGSLGFFRWVYRVKGGQFDWTVNFKIQRFDRDLRYVQVPSGK